MVVRDICLCLVRVHSLLVIVSSSKSEHLSIVPNYLMVFGVCKPLSEICLSDTVLYYLEALVLIGFGM
jgi:hypothetical protein